MSSSAPREAPSVRHSHWSLSRFTSILLVAMTWIVFFQVREFRFVDFDDAIFVFDNQHVMGGLTADNVRWAFSWPSTSVGH